MLDAIQSVFNAFGAIVFVPVILFIVAKCMGVQTKKAVDCAILSAVGLEGFTLIINSYSGIISPIIEQMVETTGVSLQIVDIGWQATSVVAYSTTIGIIFFAIAVILQLALLLHSFLQSFPHCSVHCPSPAAAQQVASPVDVLPLHAAIESRRAPIAADFIRFFFIFSLVYLVSNICSVPISYRRNFVSIG